MNLGIEKRIALVVGASRGIGLEVARELRAEGCEVQPVSRTHGYDLMTDEGLERLFATIAPPDIIVHVPTPEGGNRAVGNFAVFELNFQAGPKEAQEDFDNLDTIIGALNYPLGVFVNIDSVRTQAASYQGAHRDRIRFFAVRLIDGAVQVRHAFYTADGLVER